MSVGHQKTEMHTAVGSECLYQVQFHPCPHESQGFRGFLSFGGCTGKRWTWARWENPGEILALESSLLGCGLLVHMNLNVSDSRSSSNWKHHPCSPTLTSKTPSIRLIRILIPKITQERTALMNTLKVASAEVGALSVSFFCWKENSEFFPFHFLNI